MSNDTGKLLWHRIEINIHAATPPLLSYLKGIVELDVPYILDKRITESDLMKAIHFAIRSHLLSLGLPLDIVSPDDVNNLEPLVSTVPYPNKVRYTIHLNTDEQYWAFCEFKERVDRKKRVRRDPSLLYQDDPIFNQL